MRSTIPLILFASLLSAPAHATFLVPNPPGISGVEINTDEKIDAKTYKAAAAIVPLRFPRLAQRNQRILDQKMDAIIHGKNAGIEELKKKPEGRCFLEVGFYEHMQNKVKSLYNTKTITHVVATSWAVKYSVKDLTAFHEVYANPSLQKVMMLLDQEDLEMTNYLNAFLTYKKLYDEGKISLTDLKELDTLSKQPDIDLVIKFEEDSKGEVHNYLAALKKSDWSRVETNTFYQGHKKKIDACMKKGAA